MRKCACVRTSRYGGDVGGWGFGQILFHTRTQCICGYTAYGLAGEAIHDLLGMIPRGAGTAGICMDLFFRGLLLYFMDMASADSGGPF